MGAYFSLSSCLGFCHHLTFAFDPVSIFLFCCVSFLLLINHLQYVSLRLCLLILLLVRTRQNRDISTDFAFQDFPDGPSPLTTPSQTFNKQKLPSIDKISSAKKLFYAFINKTTPPIKNQMPTTPTPCRKLYVCKCDKK